MPQQPSSLHQTALHGSRGLRHCAHLENLRVVLVSARNPLNIGAAARAMSNFGVSQLRLVSPYEPSFREARSAVGASAVLASAGEFDDLAAAVADCVLVVGTTDAHSRESRQPVLALEEAARWMRNHLAVRPVALVFGSEKFGLSNEQMSHCHWLLRIPTHEQNPSMNLGQAVAVCLYELARETEPPPPPVPASPAVAGQRERITSVLIEILGLSGYLKTATPAAQEKVRRLVFRLGLSSEDAETWLGMLRQVLWKLRHPSFP